MPELYNKYFFTTFYEENGGGDYTDHTIWERNFEWIADKIVEIWNPQTVLDAGCAFGYLVEALRKKGVMAYGIDISSYAISQVPNEIKDYCAVKNLTDELPKNFPQKYDLVVTIEVLEHLEFETAKLALKKLCSYTDCLLFSSTPIDIDDATHCNVQLRETWARIFAENNFFHNLIQPCDWLTPWAMLMEHSTDIPAIVNTYERIMRIESARKNKAIEECNKNIESLQNDLKHAEEENVEWKNSNKKLALAAADIKNLEDELQGKSDFAKSLENTLNELKQQMEGALLEKLELEEKIRLTEDRERKNTERADEIANVKDSLVLENRGLVLENRRLMEKIELINSNIADLRHYNHLLRMDYDASARKSSDLEYMLVLERKERINKQEMYEAIAHSTMWRMTRPIRKVKDFILRKNEFSPEYQGSSIEISHQNVMPNATPTIQESEVGHESFHRMKAVDYPLTGHPIQPIPFFRVLEDGKRLNIVTDSIEADCLLGGVATALILATEFCKKYSYDLRIVTRNVIASPQNYSDILDLHGLTPAPQLSFYSDIPRDCDFKMDIHPGDIFMATSWWSAEAIRRMHVTEKIFYIIQEIETFFYPHGTEHYLCSRIMKDTNIKYLVNSKYLYDYFSDHEPNICENGAFFNPAFPEIVYAPDEFEKKNKYTFFFYARPNNPRNMFAYGLHLICEAIDRNIIDVKEWEVCFAGQQVEEIELPKGANIKYLGRMSWEEYGKFLKTVDLAISLMYTPHPSYPPYDIACSGGVVVTNRCENKRTMTECSNIIVADLEENEFLNALEDGVELAKDIKRRKSNYEASEILRGWDNALEEVIQYMGENI